MKQNIEKISKWKRENITRLQVEVRNDSGIMERLSMAVDGGLARSRQAYVLSAIEAALDRDGVPKVGNESRYNTPLPPSEEGA